MFRQKLFDECNAGNREAAQKTNFFIILSRDFAIDKSRALKLHKKFYSEWLQLKQVAIDKVTIYSEQVKGEMNVLSKLERIQMIQNLFMSPLAPAEAVLIHRELSKMNGDYSPARVDAQVAMMQVEQQKPDLMEIDYNLLSTETLM